MRSRASASRAAFGELLLRDRLSVSITATGKALACSSSKPRASLKPALIGRQDFDIPVFDATRIHVEAVVEFA